MKQIIRFAFILFAYAVRSFAATVASSFPQIEAGSGSPGDGFSFKIWASTFDADFRPAPDFTVLFASFEESVGDTPSGQSIMEKRDYLVLNGYNRQENNPATAKIPPKAIASLARAINSFQTWKGGDRQLLAQVDNPETIITLREIGNSPVLEITSDGYYLIDLTKPEATALLKFVMNIVDYQRTQKNLTTEDGNWKPEAYEKIKDYKRVEVLRSPAEQTTVSFHCAWENRTNDTTITGLSGSGNAYLKVTLSDQGKIVADLNNIPTYVFTDETQRASLDSLIVKFMEWDAISNREDLTVPAKQIGTLALSGTSYDAYYARSHDLTGQITFVRAGTKVEAIRGMTKFHLSIFDAPLALHLLRQHAPEAAILQSKLEGILDKKKSADELLK